MTANSLAIAHKRTDNATEPANAEFAMFRDLAYYAPTLLWMTDAEGAMVFLNQGYLNFTGLALEEALKSDSWVKIVHPSDRTAAISAYMHAFRRQNRFKLEYRLRRYDGVFRQMLDIAEPRKDVSGAFHGYVGCTIDVTEQKQQEQVLHETHRQIERRSHELGVLHDLQADLEVCRTIDETRPILSRYGRKLFPDRPATIFLYNNSRNLVEPFASWGTTERVDQMFSPEQCWSLRKGKPHCENRMDDGGICPNPVTCKQKSYLCMPMTAFGETIGVILFDGLPEAMNDENREAENRQLITQAADEIGRAIEELKLRARLHNQSIRDPLTKLFNRRHLMAVFERELHRAMSESLCLSLLMIDIDHFKQFNDMHGHPAGDQLLNGFGTLLQRTVRGSDVACRYGGEEFTVLMPNCPSEGARNRAEEIRRETERLRVESGGNRLQGVTVSIGYASFPRDGQTTEQLLAAADRALYKAKKGGRNQVTGADAAAAAASA